jgi:hypothetical protein
MSLEELRTNAERIRRYFDVANDQVKTLEQLLVVIKQLAITVDSAAIEARQLRGELRALAEKAETAAGIMHPDIHQ